jgi:hypothetical protein
LTVTGPGVRIPHSPPEKTMPRKGHFCFEMDVNQTKFKRAAKAKQKVQDAGEQLFFLKPSPKRLSLAIASNRFKKDFYTKSQGLISNAIITYFHVGCN